MSPVGCENSCWSEGPRRNVASVGKERTGHRDAEGAECKSRRVIAPRDHYFACGLLRR